MISEDEPVDAIRKLVDGTRPSDADPGRRNRAQVPVPLVSRLAKGKRITARPIAVTVIPGDLSDAAAG